MLCNSSAVVAQSNEAGFLVGGMSGNENQFELPPRIHNIKTDLSFTFQVNYARRLFGGDVAALYLDVPLVYTPRTEFEATTDFFPSSYSSLFFTPGLKLKVASDAALSPYAVAGAGLARLSSSDTFIDGRPIPPLSIGGGSETYRALSYGGGLDVKVTDFVSIRGEARDFYTRAPELRVNLFTDRQHNIVVTGGIVLRF